MAKYDVTVKLIGEDGNAFSILAAVTRGLKKANASSEDMQAFREKAMSSDYNHLLQVCMEYVNVS